MPALVTYDQLVPILFQRPKLDKVHIFSPFGQTATSRNEEFDRCIFQVS